MKKLLVPALVLAAASAAALPATAQIYGPRAHAQANGYWQPINARLNSLDRRIDVGLRSGQLSRREAVRLRSDFDSLLRLEASYRRGGLTAWERADLDRRFDRLSVQIRNERRDRGNRRS